MSLHLYLVGRCRRGTGTGISSYDTARHRHWRLREDGKIKHEGSGS